MTGHRIDPFEHCHRFATVGDVRLHYVEIGAGEPVLLIPGWPQSWYAWRKVAPLLVTQGRRAIILDPRGMGESDKPELGYDLDSAAGDVHRLLAALDLADRGGIDVVSHDVGSWIAYALASSHPETCAVSC